MMNATRTDFLRAAAFSAAAFPMLGNAKPVGKIRVGIVGLGMRGKGAVKRLSKIQDVEIVALCDLREEMVSRAAKILADAGRSAAQTFFGTEEVWKDLVALDLDLVYIAAPWRWHTPMCVHAMKNGKHAATEVPSATSVDECWELVDTAEKTGKHCMQLENCCYDFFELQTLNMVRQGVFGELTHAEGAYIHTLCGLIAKEDGGYQGQWRFHQNNTKNGNLYPTHGLGPIAQCLNINRGNRFEHLVSMSSQQAAFTAWAAENNKPEMAALENYRGDMNTTLIKCAKGQTVMVQHDVSTPRPYSRIHLLQGTKGMVRKYPEPRIALGHKWQSDEQMKELAAKYEHPLSRTMGAIAKKVGGHGGMDFIMDYRLIYCLKNGLPLDQDVYDAAAWSSVMPLSIKSVAKDSDRIKVPDFTRGKWKTNASLGIVDVDPAKLPVVGM
ncbi:Gfo/Idh/MocA family protein [Pontiella sulfatireligans]|uniref:Glycosyl hydrolase family 109 protein 1 n=1 Tax=Pontiella sulfatireligans TaxID=2750658 RepID=A0A6C2URQ1_9BACT|nr:Gfo/Idh/MocA family oxidoreductase [Pontiella sulfatireligans]VGO21907.1 Glycosyl hydrolase family 109 protein 1 [Pontiella sulfatireligans]